MAATCTESNTIEPFIDLFFKFSTTTSSDFSYYDSSNNEIVITPRAQNYDFIGDYTYRIQTSTLNNAISAYFYV